MPELPLTLPVIKIINECSQVRTYVFENKFQKFSPGQFFMLWVPEKDEKPFSPSFADKKEIHITISAVGPITKYINSKVKVGDKLGLRGPYGKDLT